MKRPGVGRGIVIQIMNGLLVLSLWGIGMGASAAGVVTRVLANGEGVELEISTDIDTQKEVIPLFKSGGIRYFSADVGQVEREATYPPFSLKLVFTAGGKPFVSGVAVNVRDANGRMVLTVPPEHITGPWLFIDLPDGAYEVTATLGGHRQEAKGVKVKRGQVMTRHVRWAEDRSSPLAAQPE
jgi:hypothetical protein